MSVSDKKGQRNCKEPLDFGGKLFQLEYIEKLKTLN